MMRSIFYLAGFASLALLVAGPPAFAQSKTTSSDKTTTKSSAAVVTHRMTDAEFAKSAAAGGMGEIKLGQLAEDKGTNQAVKDFGKRMVTDHSKADDDLKSAASKVNIPLPSDLSAKDRATYDRLSKLSGAAFDRAYAREMVRDHVADVSEFRVEAKDGKDTSIKDFASRTLPTLEDHLKDARGMLHDVSATSSTAHQKSAAHTGA